MKSNFEYCLNETLKWEGGYSNHPSDPGGATQKGVTQARYNEYRNDTGRSKRSVRHLEKAELQDIYRKYYWDVVKGDSLPSGVDLAVFDFAVNSGPSRAARYLQNIVGAKPDGKIGPMTIETVEGMHIPFTIKALCDDRLAFVKRLKTWRVFGKGWSRRIKGIKKAALKLAKSSFSSSRERQLPLSSTPSILEVIIDFLKRLFIR